MKRLLLLGASGSIGQQTVDIVLQHPDQFEIVSFGVGRNIEQAKKYIALFPDVKTLSVQNREDAEILQKEYPDHTILYGDEGMIELVRHQDYDLLVNALVGFAGFLPTYTAIQCGHDIALANKETLVCGGDLINAALREYNCHLYPIDSEHSAIWQALQGNDRKRIRNLWITCSGGAFRNKTRQEMAVLGAKEALAHPNWSMGAKITIDSATLMNKGFEVIEAHYLFDVDYDRIQVVLHPESVVHSAVEYVDHSIMAQMGAPDMRLPIQYALTAPDRLPFEQKESLDLCTLGTLHFSAPDTERFPLLKLAFEVGKKGGNLGAVMNSANEIANAAFRNGEIPFLMIEKCVIGAVRAAQWKPLHDVSDLLEADAFGRDYALNLIQKEKECS